MTPVKNGGITGIAEVLRTPGGTEYWRRSRDYFSDDAARELDRVIGLSEQTWLDRFGETWMQ